MSDFSKAVEVILRHEGGYVDHPNDPGGPTKYGISLRFIREQLGHGDATADDVKDVFRGQAEGIYFTYFWHRYGYGKISDQQVATKVFDMAVNMGPEQAHKLLQRALCSLGLDLDVDGILGPNTLAATNVAEPKRLLQRLVEVQCGFYRALAESKPSMHVFLAGWLERAAWPSKEAA